jgi:hypothetical protein
MKRALFTSTLVTGLTGLLGGCIITLPPATSETAGETDPSGTDATDATTSTSTTTNPTSESDTLIETGATTDLTTTTTTTTEPTSTTAPDTCDDGLQSGDETDIDCGGPTCAPCPLSASCLLDSDCQSALCQDGACAPAFACDDGLQNGDESDIDCGGDCLPCLPGGACLGDDDCIGTCTEGQCDPVQCVADQDCAGFSTQCALSLCQKGACVFEPINEAAPCDDADLCTDGTTCALGVCTGGQLPDCSGLDDACNLGACDPIDGQCKPEPVLDGTPCVDSDLCTTNEACLAGACLDQDGSDHLLYEPFADNSAGWLFFNTTWQIGAAQAGCGDPALDHSPTDDNGVAGVVLGGCLTAPGGHALISPKIDATGQKDLWLSYYHVLGSDNPATETRLEVFDGDKWIVLDTFPAVTEVDWTLSEYDLTPYAGPALQLRWWHLLLADQPPPVGSWNLDDIVLGPAGCVPY